MDITTYTCPMSLLEGGYKEQWAQHLVLRPFRSYRAFYLDYPSKTYCFSGERERDAAGMLRPFGCTECCAHSGHHEPSFLYLAIEINGLGA